MVVSKGMFLKYFAGGRNDQENFRFMAEFFQATVVCRFGSLRIHIGVFVRVFGLFETGILVETVHQIHEGVK